MYGLNLLYVDYLLCDRTSCKVWSNKMSSVRSPYKEIGMKAISITRDKTKKHKDGCHCTRCKPAWFTSSSINDIKASVKKAVPPLCWADKVFGQPNPITGKRQTFSVTGEKTGGKW